MKASELVHRAVVSLTDGTKVGEVTDLILDMTHVTMKALVLGGHEGTSVIPFAAMRNIGTDAVMIDNTLIVQAPAPLGEIADPTASTLTGFTVLNHEGTIIGNVDDVEFDEKSGRITALLIHRGGVIGIGSSRESIPAAAIRGIGARLVTVDTASPP